MPSPDESPDESIDESASATDDATGRSVTDQPTARPLGEGLPLRLAPIASRWVLPPLVAGVIGLVLFPPVGLTLLAVAAFAVWFFRDPPRSSPDEDTLPPTEGVVAPADGRVSLVRTDGDRVRVGVFMSPLDVHVTRVPAGGELVRLDHRPGGHWPAFSKASDRNERVEFTIDAPVGRLDGAMIAGTVARRAHAYHAAGDRLARGDRLGCIAFGSRTDLVLPERFDASDVRVTEGEQVTAGETILTRRDD